ncbi:hypothetical protein OEZ86_004065 [Tetradesmus obliquus]|nr:hypothetical protein OEZ86_004065 [Tetradesmus obliquus]
MQLSELASQLCSSFRPQQFSNVLWGLAKCGFKAPAAWLGPYLEQAELQLHHFQPRNLAQLAWALAAMKAQPPRSFLANFLAECSDKLSLFKPIDLAHTLWALATLAVTPPADWLSSALAACSAQWQQFKPQELSITVWGLARLGGGFRTQLYPAHPHYGLTAELGEGGLAGLMAAAAWQVPAMSPQQASNLVWGLAVGGAVLPPQQLQALAGQVLLVLRNSAAGSSSSSSNSSSVTSKRRQQRRAQAAANLHCYNPGQMVTLMQTLGVMLRDRGHDAVQCHSLLKLLAVAAQWRLHQGRAGDCEVCGRYVRALKFMAAEANVSQLLVLSWRAEAGAGG